MKNLIIFFAISFYCTIYAPCTENSMPSRRLTVAPSLLIESLSPHTDNARNLLLAQLAKTSDPQSKTVIQKKLQALSSCGLIPHDEEASHEEIIQPSYQN